MELFIPGLYAYVEFTSVNVQHEAILFYVQFLGYLVYFVKQKNTETRKVLKQIQWKFLQIPSQISCCALPASSQIPSQISKETPWGRGL